MNNQAATQRARAVVGVWTNWWDHSDVQKPAPPWTFDTTKNHTRRPGVFSWQLPKGCAPPNNNYAFVLNVSKLTGAESFTLAPGHEPRRGTPEEVSTIRTVLQQYMQPPQFLVWEHRLEKESTWTRMTDEEEKWQYFVISFQGLNSTLVEIEDALSLAPLELKVAFTVVTKLVPESPLEHLFGPGVLIHPGRFFYLTQGGLPFLYTPLLEVGASDVTEMVLLHQQIRQHDDRLLDVKRLIGQLHGLEALPPDSPLFFLGYFAVLESLLVHPPKPTDPYDSITRQVKQKIALVSRRSKFAVDYGSFGEARSDTVWTKMYKYRSELAHGGAPTFTEELQALGTHSRALHLLRQTVKMLIRQALVEPQLIADLREC
jgi:hypothetical protein